jgi:hypothetical protein
MIVPAGGTPTEVPVVEASTSGLTVVAAAAAGERPSAIAEREHDLLAGSVVGVAPVREEGADVLADPFAETRHAPIVPGTDRGRTRLEPHAEDATMRS